ncbi:MAG: hypothetical protein HY242_12350 [Afipia sp.]|nr:hypothetical protein [Afipia sp.]
MIGFPLLLIPLAIYNIFVFLMPGVAFTSQIVTVTLMSGVQWTLTFGDALIALAIVLLMFEVIKASRPGTRYLTDHLLSLMVFGGATAEFLLLKALGTSDFFLLTVLTGVEFVAGTVIGLRNRRYAAVSAAPQPMRQEPVVVPKPDKAPSEPKRADVIPSEAKPPEMMTVSPAPVAPSSALNAQPGAEKKVSDWSMSDLVSDRDQSSIAGGAPKSNAEGDQKP